MADDQLDKQIGFTRPEMGTEKLAGKSEPPSVRHAFCVVKTSADSWPKEAASTLLEKLQAALNKSDVRITACEALEGLDEEGDVLVFPDFVRVTAALKSEADIADFAGRLKSVVPLAVGEDCVLLTKTQVMVCAHTKRDSRCGFCGTKLVDEFERLKKDSNKMDVCDVRKCSHIGGHNLAGNVLVFRPSLNAPEIDGGCGGDWFGYVKPSDVPAFLEFATLDSSTYPPHSVHRLWRGRFGVKDKEHIDLCEKVSAACSSCTESVRDMEDGVAGWPSPTVKDENARKQFLSPPTKKIESKPEEQPLVPSKPARVVFILGAPGSGKGTQCGNLIRDYDLIHLSAGDLLRDERANPNSKDGQLIESYIKEGKIVPVAITVGLLWAAMKKNMLAGHYNFLIDGFPRNQDNLDGWKAQMGPEKARVAGVIFLDCPEAIVEERLLERGKTSGRIDDNLASIRKRFGTFANETMPIVNLFEKQKMCWKIDSTRPKDVVYVDVRRVIDEFVLPTKRTVMFVLGGPGAGKGTQCANLVRDFDCTHLSAGDLLRAERADPNSKDGKLIESYIVEGKIVPVEITVNLLMRAMSQSGARNFLIDGFPRNMDNLEGWNRVLSDKSHIEVAGVLFFDVPEEVMEKRLLDRATKDGANARSDDNVNVIKKRFKTFRDETMPIVEQFQRKKMVWVVGADRPVEDVYRQVHLIAQQLFLPDVKKRSAPQRETLTEPAVRAVLDMAVKEDKLIKIVLIVTSLTAVVLVGAYLWQGRNKL